MTWETTYVKVRSSIETVMRAWGYIRRQSPAIDMGDLQVVTGFGALVYGVSLVSVPGAWMLAGTLLLAGWAIPRLRVPRREKE